MQRFHQIIFVVSLLALSWYGMQAVHELGHVVGALATGGSLQQVVLHPLTISRTDVSPNPSPAVVVWLGPLVGSLLPMLIFATVPSRWSITEKLARFFAGFCMIANGAYISIGSIDAIGDCGEMLRTGTPHWLLVAFGAVTIPAGFYLWHSLGSVVDFLRDPNVVQPRMACAACVLLLLITIALAMLNP